VWNHIAAAAAAAVIGRQSAYWRQGVACGYNLTLAVNWLKTGLNDIFLYFAL